SLHPGGDARHREPRDRHGRRAAHRGGAAPDDPGPEARPRDRPARHPRSRDRLSGRRVRLCPAGRDHRCADDLLRQRSNRATACLRLISICQLRMACLPVVVVVPFVGGPLYLVLSSALLLMFVGVVSITLSVFRTLRDQIVAAEASAQMAERMRELARSDSVTGLLNRGGLAADAHELLARLPESRKLALFWIDLDRFKEVNDSLGHPVGDRMLAAVAARLAAAAPAGAALSRFGGDEFIVVAEVADREECERLARTLAHSISRPVHIEGHRI